MFDFIAKLAQENPVLMKYTLLVLDYSVRSILVLFSGLSSIYIIKFWINFKKARIWMKNLFAFISMLVLTVGTSLVSKSFLGFPLATRVTESVLVMMTAMLLFALLAPHLDRRIDKFLDRKLGKD